MGAIFQVELEIKAEWAETDRSVTKARGKSGRHYRTEPDKLEQARIVYKNSDKSVRNFCELFRFPRGSLFSYMKTTQNS